MNSPQQDQIQPLINLYQQGQLQQALGSTKQLLKQFPNSLILYNTLCTLPSMIPIMIPSVVPNKVGGSL